MTAAMTTGSYHLLRGGCAGCDRRAVARTARRAGRGRPSTSRRCCAGRGASTRRLRRGGQPSSNRRRSRGIGPPDGPKRFRNGLMASIAGCITRYRASSTSVNGVHQYLRLHCTARYRARTDRHDRTRYAAARTTIARLTTAAVLAGLCQSRRGDLVSGRGAASRSSRPARRPGPAACLVLAEVGAGGQPFQIAGDSSRSGDEAAKLGVGRNSRSSTPSRNRLEPALHRGGWQLLVPTIDRASTPRRARTTWRSSAPTSSSRATRRRDDQGDRRQEGGDPSGIVQK